MTPIDKAIDRVRRIADMRAELDAHHLTFQAAVDKIAWILQEAQEESPVLMPAIITQLVAGTASFLRAAYGVDPAVFMDALRVDVLANLQPREPATITRDYSNSN